MVSVFPPSTVGFTSVNDNFIGLFDYDANGNLIYQGWNYPGAQATDTTWRIKKYTYNASNLLTGTTFPQDVNGNPSCGFGFQWAIRTSYVYS